MPNTFESHVVLVTGAAGGIGGATAAEFAARGAEVVLADLSAPDELAATLTAKFEARCRAVAMDVTSSDSIASAFAAVGRDVSIVVNNAGVMQRLSADHHTLPEADLDRMLAVHVSGAAKVAAAALPAMRRVGFGRIINISSVIGHVGLQRRTSYSTAKAAIGGLTRGLALENGRYGVTVNSVSPGYVLTDVLRAKIAAGTLAYEPFAQRSAVGRWAAPVEIARVIRFLAEPASGFITGADWLVDGGYAVNGNPGEDLGPLAGPPA